MVLILLNNRQIRTIKIQFFLTVRILQILQLRRTSRDLLNPTLTLLPCSSHTPSNDRLLRTEECQALLTRECFEQMMSTFSLHITTVTFLFLKC